MQPDGDEGIQYSKLIDVATYIAVKSGGKIPRTLCLFICGMNILEALFLETSLHKYIYSINKCESILVITI